MKKDRLRIYAIEALLLIFITLALFVLNITNRKTLAILITIFAILTNVIIKKKKSISYYSNQVALLMLGFSLIYLITFYLMGIYFSYYTSPTKFSINTLINFVLPLTIIIVASESIRKKLIIQKGFILKLVVFIILVFIDLIVYATVYDLMSLDDVLTIVGFVLFSSISCNLLYNYITVRYGSKGVLIYRLFTSLYLYFIPIVPNVYLFFRSFLRMVYPYLMYLILEYTYSKSDKATAYKDKTKNILITSIVMVSMTLVIMLVSCRFRFGILVIGSGSMTGSINKGDAVIFEQYKSQKLKSGDVIIFDKDGVQTVHRIYSIEVTNGQTRYFTKGDANKEIDDGYRVDKDIAGITKVKIKYIGYPTIWVRNIFEV